MGHASAQPLPATPHRPSSPPKARSMQPHPPAKNHLPPAPLHASCSGLDDSPSMPGGLKPTHPSARSLLTSRRLLLSNREAVTFLPAMRRGVAGAGRGVSSCMPLVGAANNMLLSEETCFPTSSSQLPPWVQRCRRTGRAHLAKTCLPFSTYSMNPGAMYGPRCAQAGRSTSCTDMPSVCNTGACSSGGGGAGSVVHEWMGPKCSCGLIRVAACSVGGLGGHVAGVGPTLPGDM